MEMLIILILMDICSNRKAEKFLQKIRLYEKHHMRCAWIRIKSDLEIKLGVNVEKIIRPFFLENGAYLHKGIFDNYTEKPLSFEYKIGIYWNILPNLERNPAER